MDKNIINPEEFLGAKVVSPLEQEKLVGGIASALEAVETTVTVTVTVTVTKTS
ncbi:hypothetical protein HZQ28_07845 [Elizabethkingia anophelis]|nr:hypothetical protein [Elizabethkingia anophelis]MCT3994396.1 hypothetical protein [Elizabethkingia anophelis]MCT3997886.1 hypothetical protein [Elizabethkingia anophelis]MCT4254931.1 hypothetical protein [Elizabethkingia anophelis]